MKWVGSKLPPGEQSAEILVPFFLGRQLFLLLFSKNFHETSTHCYSGIHFSFKHHIDPCLRCKYVLCLAGL